MLEDTVSVAMTVGADMTDFSEKELAIFEEHILSWKNATLILSSTQSFLRTEEYEDLAILIKSDAKYKMLLFERYCENTNDRLLYELLLNELVLKEISEVQKLMNDVGYKQALQIVINSPERFI